MSHPYNEIRSHHIERKRVSRIASGYGHEREVEAEPVRTTHIAHHKRGGKVAHSDEAADRKLVRGMVKESALKHRQDKVKRAKGGRTNAKHKGTNVNVIVAPQGGHQAGAMPPPAAAAPPPMMPRPPMAGGPPGAGVVPPPGLGAPGLGAPPPGLGPRRDGGRAYARGGAVQNGPAWDGMMKSITPVQHSDGKGDGKNIGRGKPVTYATGGGVEPANVAPLTPRKTPSGVAGLSGSGSGVKRKTGGPIYAPATGHMGPKFDGGSGGGEARDQKAERARKMYARS